jgi:YD repeat-containing protein
MADGSCIDYGYDSAGRLATITDAKGKAQQLGYTIDDRLAGITHPHAPAITYAYDAAFPRLVQMTDGSGATTYRYGPVGAPGALQLAAITTPLPNAAINYSYDPAGQLTAMTVAGSTETYRYDALGRLVTTSNDLGTFSYDYLGETTAPTAEHLQGLLRPLTAYHYERNRQDRRLAAIDHPRKARSYDYQSSPYTIDGIDEQGRNRNTTDWRFFYDNADRLVEAHGGFRQDFTFDYDQADNLTRMTTPDGTTIMHPDQTNAIHILIQRRSGLPGPKRLHPDYDPNGNLTDDGERHYTWDGLNHLTAIDYHGHPRWHTTLSYDGLDHLVSITERDGKDTQTQHLLWCGEAICGLTDDSGTLLTRIFDQGEWHKGQVHYYARDHLG